jgi:hypothetical protein
MKPEGLLIFNVANTLRFDGWPLLHFLSIKKLPFRSFTPWGIASILRRHGYRIVATAGDIPVLLRWVALVRKPSAKQSQPKTSHSPAKKDGNQGWSVFGIGFFRSGSKSIISSSLRPSDSLSLAILAVKLPWMAKVDWEKNSAKNILGKAGLWPWKDEEIESILDVGCGLSFQSKFLPAKIRVGVDMYEEYFKHIEADVPYVVIKYDARKLRDIFVPKSFDLVLATDIIEHLEKAEGDAMLRQCEEIARKGVIIDTPKGYHPQNIDIWGHGGHEWQTHRSGWDIKDFEERGYKCTVHDYVMSDVKRHTEIDVDPHIQIINAVKYMDRQ